MARSDYRFSYPKRIRMAEVDAAAIVFNARYLDYLDIALSEYLRAAGLPDRRDRPPLVFARTTIEYHAPLRLDEMVDLCVRCAGIGHTSLRIAFEYHGGGADDLRCTGESVLVHVMPGVTGSSPVPESVAGPLTAYENRDLRA